MGVVSQILKIRFFTPFFLNFYEIPIINIFSRVYPQSTAGKPISIYYNTISHVFIYEYDHDPTILEPTEIFIPQFLYSNGFNTTLSDHLISTFDKGNSLLLVTLDSEWAQHFMARIMIEPK